MIRKIWQRSAAAGLMVFVAAGLASQGAKADVASDVSAALSAPTTPQAAGQLSSVARANPTQVAAIVNQVTASIPAGNAADFAGSIAMACPKAPDPDACTRTVVEGFIKAFPEFSGEIVNAVIEAGGSRTVALAALGGIGPAAGLPFPSPGDVPLNPGVGLDLNNTGNPKTWVASTRLLQVLPNIVEPTTSPDEPNDIRPE